MNTFSGPGIADKVIATIKQQVLLFEDFSDVYLFGSVLDSENNDPEDIDILLMYSVLPETLLGAIELIRSTLEKQCGMSIDLTVLSRAEEQEVHFLERLNSFFYKVK